MADINTFMQLNTKNFSEGLIPNITTNRRIYDPSNLTVSKISVSQFHMNTILILICELGLIKFTILYRNSWTGKL